MINFESLPFFGKINSICKIIKVDDDENKYYIVKRYDHKGNEKKEDFIVPINPKNTKGIIEDYCKDIKDYLIKDEKKYNEYKTKKKIFNFNISTSTIKSLEIISNLGICLGTVLTGLSFSLISMPILLYSGVIILVISGIGNVVVGDINKEVIQTEFINTYDNYSKQLNEYKSYLDSKLKTKPTEYNGLTKEKNKGNSIKLKKVKALN